MLGGVGSVAEVSDPAPTQDGTLNGAQVLLMLGKDKANKTLAELAPNVTVGASRRRDGDQPRSGGRHDDHDGLMSAREAAQDLTGDLFDAPQRFAQRTLLAELARRSTHVGIRSRTSSSAMPTIATIGTSCSAASSAMPPTTLPSKLCASRWPSPVITRSAR